MDSSKVEALQDKAHDLADSISDRMDQVRRSAAPVVKRARRKAGVLLDQGGEMLSDVSDRASEAASALSKSLVSYTKKNPLTALVLALGAGALLVSAVKSIRSQR
jgi:ElaB/YqjD/DUF883 family membrane-anchored ribosome-binding protein